MKSAAALGLILVLAGSAVRAQPAAAPPVADESAVVQELEVVARPPGPAMWKVARGGAEVTILGAVSPLPHSLVWDQRRFQRALVGANAVLLQAPFRPSVLDMVGLLMKAQALRSSADLETQLPPPVLERFVAARTAAGKDARRYAKWKPAVAGFLVRSDALRAHNLSEAKPTSTVRRMAQAAKVPITNVGGFKLNDIASAFANLSDAANRACLNDALDQLGDETAHAEAAANAWAAGDLKGVRKDYGAAQLERCLLQLRNYNQVLETTTVAWVKAVDAALAKPGKSAAVIDLRLLLRANGVLDRLKAQGAQISVPLEPVDGPAQVVEDDGKD